MPVEMNNPLPPNIAQLLNSEPIRTQMSKLNDQQKGSFADILTESIATTTATDKIDKQNTLDTLMGESDDLSGMLLDMQKAELALQLTLQIRNKIVDAYNEVTKMSV